MSEKSPDDKLDESNMLWATVRLAAEVSDWKRDSETLVQWAERTLKSARSAVAPTISADSHDELPPMACIVRASGEGITDWRLCRNEAEVRAAYVDMVCGSDDEHHKEEIDGIMEAFRGEGWRGDVLKIDLYCASFTAVRFPAACLTAHSASGPTFNDALEQAAEFLEKRAYHHNETSPTREICERRIRDLAGSIRAMKRCATDRGKAT